MATSKKSSKNKELESKPKKCKHRWSDWTRNYGPWVGDKGRIRHCMYCYKQQVDNE